MKHLELHILQSFPVTCLNRDDFNSPKTAVFGGKQRARVSSQSWKRAIRELAAKDSPRFRGERTRLIVELLRDDLLVAGIGEDRAMDKARELADALATFDKDAEKKTGVIRVKTLFYASPAERAAIAAAYASCGDAKKAVKEVQKGQKHSKSELLKDAADIALFGRMVANNSSLTLEGAAQFGHALSTHVVENEPEYFSAVDDLQPKDEAGAGMTGTIEYNSATYYRFAALNLGMLKDEDHLEALSAEERREVVGTFIDATLRAIPGARRNSMNGNTTPAYVRAIVRTKGHPIQLVNAFESPIRPGSGGLVKPSVDALEAHYAEQNRLWGLDRHELVSACLPEVGLAELLEKVLAHVD